MKQLLLILLLFSFWISAEELSDLEPSPDPHQKIKQIQIDDLSDLQQLTPFKSISVIQKRYLPKTFRGELNLSLASFINHHYIYLAGLGGRLGFFVREDHGFGIETLGQLPLLKFVSVDLIKYNKLFPDFKIIPHFYGGAYYKWSPVFGKFSVLDKKIIYFDTYITIGGGVTIVTEAKPWLCNKIWDYGLTHPDCESPPKSPPKPEADYYPALSLSIGQVFAITQDWAFNWDLKALFNFDLPLGEGEASTQWWQDIKVHPYINLSLGANYYFPGAKYR